MLRVSRRGALRRRTESPVLAAPLRPGKTRLRSFIWMQHAAVFACDNRSCRSMSAFGTDDDASALGCSVSKVDYWSDTEGFLFFACKPLRCLGWDAEAELNSNDNNNNRSVDVFAVVSRCDEVTM